MKQNNYRLRYILCCLAVSLLIIGLGQSLYAMKRKGISYQGSNKRVRTQINDIGFTFFFDTRVLYSGDIIELTRTPEGRESICLALLFADTNKALRQNTYNINKFRKLFKEKHKDAFGMVLIHAFAHGHTFVAKKLFSYALEHNYFSGMTLLRNCFFASLKGNVLELIELFRPHQNYDNNFNNKIKSLLKDEFPKIPQNGKENALIFIKRLITSNEIELRKEKRFPPGAARTPGPSLDEFFKSLIREGNVVWLNHIIYRQGEDATSNRSLNIFESYFEQNLLNYFSYAKCLGYLEIAMSIYEYYLARNGHPFDLGFNDFHVAIMKNNTPTLRHYLNADHRYTTLHVHHYQNSQEHNVFDPLSLSALYGNIESYEMLKEYGAKLYITTLSASVQSRDTDILARVLRDYKKSFNQANEQNRAQLMDYLKKAFSLAVENGDKNIIKCFLENTADLPLNMKDAFYAALQKHKAEVIEILLKNSTNKKALIDSVNDLYTVINRAISYNRYDFLKVLLKHIEIEDAHPLYDSLLVKAIIYQHTALFDLILKYGASPNAQISGWHIDAEATTNILNSRGIKLSGEQIRHSNWSALIVAATFGHKNLVKTLLSYGANPWHEAGHSLTLLSLSVANGWHEIVDELLIDAHEKNINPFISNNEGNTIIHIAVANGLNDMLVKLLPVVDENDIDPFMTNAKGNNIIHIALRRGRLDLAQDLIKRAQPKDLLAINNENFSPAHYTAEMGDTELLEQILSKNISLKDISESSNLSLIEVATEHNHKDFIAHLQNKDDFTLSLSVRINTLREAIKNDNLELVKTLMNDHFDNDYSASFINRRDNFLWLIWNTQRKGKISNKRKKLIKHFIEKDANPFIHEWGKELFYDIAQKNNGHFMDVLCQCLAREGLTFKGFMELGSSIIDEIADKDISQVLDKLLKAGIDPEYALKKILMSRDAPYCRMVHVAIKHCTKEEILRLTSNGIDILSRTLHKKNRLNNTHRKILSLLHEKGAIEIYKNEQGQTCLHKLLNQEKPPWHLLVEFIKMDTFDAILAKEDAYEKSILDYAKEISVPPSKEDLKEEFIERLKEKL